jgi:ABC-2 type transport system permease protein
MDVISRQVFSPNSGGKWIDQAMKSLEQSPQTSQDAPLRDLLTSVRGWMRQQSDAPPAAGGTGSNPLSSGLSTPFETKTEKVTGGKNAVYNGYAHSFGGMGLQFILMFGIECAVALLMERKSGMWRRLRAAPVSRATVLTGRALSCALVSFLTLGVCWFFAIVVFGVRVHGSWAGFILINAGAALLAASFALMLAGIGRSVEATRGIAIFAVLMLVMLGGAWMPSFIFPEWLQSITQFIPTRWAVDGFDAMTWRGLPFSSVATPLLSMAGCVLLFGFIAWWRFRWEGE